MKIITGLFFLTLVVLFSCKKDKFTTEPQVTVKSISPDEVRQGTNGGFTIITLDAKYTDDDGDVDSVLIITKYYDADTATYVDTSFRSSLGGLGLPPKTRQGDMTIQFEYNTNNSQGAYVGFPNVVSKDTTATLGLVLIDAANHRSNYSESSKIRLIAP